MSRFSDAEPMLDVLLRDEKVRRSQEVDFPRDDNTAILLGFNPADCCLEFGEHLRAITRHMAKVLFDVSHELNDSVAVHGTPICSFLFLAHKPSSVKTILLSIFLELFQVEYQSCPSYKPPHLALQPHPE